MNIVEDQSVTEYAQIERQEIGRGVDSTVFREDGKVVKVYNKGLSREQVERYREATRQAEEFLKTHPQEGVIQLLGQPFSYSWIINPIESVSTDADGFPVVTAPFVPGPQLHQVFTESRFDAGGLDPIANFEEVALFKNIKKSLGTSEHEAKAAMHKVSAQIHEHVPFYGLRLLDINTKTRVDLSTRSIKFIVTDLAGGISRVKPRGIS